MPETRERYPRNYVLDGQQRLTALYASLTRPPAPQTGRFGVVYDLTAKEFVEVKETIRAHQLPLHVLYDPSEFLAFQNRLQESENGTQLVAEAQRLWDRFQNYEVPVITVPEVPIDTVGIIFERINSRGTRLTLFDLMIAATWGMDGSEEFNLKDNVKTILGQLADKDYGEIDEVSILRCLSVVGAESARRVSILGLREHSPEELELLIERTRSALTRAVDFLVSQSYAISSDFLPYERQLVLLTYIMAKHSTLSHDDHNVLKRWFWRSSFAERYRAGGEALFDEDLEKALQALEGADGLGRFGQAPHRSFFVGSQFRKGAAASKAFATLLASQHPRNITNGAQIDVGEALSSYDRKEFHHIFPQRVLKGWEVNKDLISALANICMLASSENKLIRDRPPSEYIKQYRSELGDQFDHVMRSNLIPPEAVEFLLADDFGNFLEALAVHLGDIVKEII